MAGMALVLAAQSAVAAPTKLFRDDTVLKAVITAPISQTYSQRKQEVRLYQPGQWTYVEETGATQRLSVKIRTRGVFRRKNCFYPPLQLNFKQSEVKGTLFAGQDKLKLVGPCKRGDNYQQQLVLEYLAYRALEELTEYSFKTRLLRLSYNDSDKAGKSWTHLTFVIEDEDDLAKRLGMAALNVPFLKPSQLDTAHAAVIELYQLMIANNDFSLLRGPASSGCCHNVKVLGAKEAIGSYLVVPYDFDSSGLVGASYALPPENVPINSVRTRYFRGLCRPQEHWDNAIALFQAKREPIIALFANSSDLNEKTRARKLKYINEFFALIDNPKRVEREIIKRCR